MPMSAAAIDGIGANGLPWKLSFNLHGQPARLGDPDLLTQADLEAIQASIVKHIRAFTSSEPARKVFSEGELFEIEQEVDDLEMVDACVDELRSVLERLYDLFDYHRICVLG